MTTYHKGTTARCNRCQRPFELPKDVSGYEMDEKKAARLTDFSTCPHCESMDCHWIHLEDIQPSMQLGMYYAIEPQPDRWIVRAAQQTLERAAGYLRDNRFIIGPVTADRLHDLFPLTRR